MESQYRRIFYRNIGVFTEAEQERLSKSTVGVAGMGGVGGLLAERPVRLGVGSLKITDPGTFEDSNLNRQFGSNVFKLGQYKSEVVRREIKDINPGASISSSNSGIQTESDAVSFIDGCDLVIDEMDYGAWKQSIFLQRAARRKGIYYLFCGAIGFGALLANFDPRGITLEEYNGLSPDQDLDNVRKISVPIEKVMPIMPSYVTAAISRDMLRDIIAGQRPVPTCSVGVGLASILAASEATNIILRRKEMIKAPQFIYIDLLDRNFITGSVSR